MYVYMYTYMYEYKFIPKKKRDMPRRGLSNISRYASATENMFAWFFRVIQSLKTQLFVSDSCWNF